jgi:hypothetical protein
MRIVVTPLDRLEDTESLHILSWKSCSAPASPKPLRISAKRHDRFQRSSEISERMSRPVQAGQDAPAARLLDKLE